ncbi:Protein ALP1-like [Linum perenne]
MNRRLFKRLCELLVAEGGLKRSKHVDIKEMVVMFLHTIGHNEKNRILQAHFFRSGQTISRHIHKVLRAILRLNRVLLCKAEPIPENSTDPRWKYFKNCLGALDGTHVKVRVIREDQNRYRDRKGDVSINVLGVCNPNTEFIYCSAGWEGSAHDGRVLRDALSRPNGFRVPRGNYYLCDAGYANSEGFLTPLRGQRYHLTEWGSNRPRTAEEYYNMKHSKARNCIERAFGIIKMRWAILRDTTWFEPMINRTIEALGGMLAEETVVEVRERDTLVEELKKLDGISEEQVFDATLLLLESDNKLRMFYRLDSNDSKKKYILRLLR